MTEKHDSKNCDLCGMLRHPALSAQTAKLREHLAKHPFPKQSEDKR
jgi:hypothetical protein